MESHIDPEHAHEPERERSSPTPDDRRRYVPPALERLGPWSVLTLQQSVGLADFEPWRDDFGW